MKETTEKYLAQMLEGYEGNLGQVESAIQQLQNQLDGLTDQRDTMVTGIKELKELLGLSEEQDEPLIFDNATE